MSNNRNPWIDIAELLLNNPNEIVTCPVCKKTNLDVFTVEVQVGNSIHLEIHMKCPKCNAYNSALKRNYKKK